jgi:prepilin-type N-terminal cleavage/methylation domain-containing protein
MSFPKNKTKGFTLIELLVVVAIVSLLSSIVLASLNSARKKAKDTAIKSAMSEVSNLMALNFNDFGSYCQIHPSGWVNGSSGTNTCDYLLSSGGFYNTYGQKARDLCQNIFNNASNSWTDKYRLLIFVSSSNSCMNSYSWIAHLNNGNWYCARSSGVKGEYTDATYTDCYTNP